ncbi:hypothetical protein GOBAR_AA19617 [Gossypium barbadense]|uniref:Uncharacterized protein n=1 Tax=Gossypium barbadense TaxID=3634 RepID=A0A2P5XCK9_GOSBA|nr:hypothetical protein GOBAR_AA19617 [Gossypium barbadense]
MGLGEICVKRIQGNYFLIEIPDEELLDILKQREWSYLKEFFVNIKPWSEKMVFSERVTWIEVSGLPMHCWNYETFKRIAGKWGTLVGDVRFSVSVREKRWSEESKNKFSQKERSQVVANESVSESESAIGLESEKLQNGNRIVSTDIIKEKVIENESVGEDCQKMLWELNEGDHDALNVGILTEDDFGACRLNSGMDRACEDVANMGLALVLGPSGGHDGSVDFDEGLGSLDMEGQHLREGNTLLPDQIYPNNHGIPETEGRGLCQEIEEEFLNTVRGRRKKKQFNKRISSMRVIQDRVLSSKEKQRRDRSRRKEKSSAASRKEDKVVNLSLSNSDISNRRKVILREAKQTWELGKKLGLSVRGDERDVIEDIMRLEDQ